jgi:hypothetical protein
MTRPCFSLRGLLLLTVAVAAVAAAGELTPLGGMGTFASHPAK